MVGLSLNGRRGKGLGVLGGWGVWWVGWVGLGFGEGHLGLVEWGV
jgi:hypothetical protein